MAELVVHELEGTRYVDIHLNEEMVRVESGMQKGQKIVAEGSTLSAEQAMCHWKFEAGSHYRGRGKAVISIS